MNKDPGMEGYVTPGPHLEFWWRSDRAPVTGLLNGHGEKTGFLHGATENH
jgi:hypothetical protein